jgi:transcription antitermination factor NusG
VDVAVGKEPDDTEGGEALTLDSTSATSSAAIDAPAGTTSPSWYALWTNSHCEQLVHDQLSERGFRAFLPTVDVWSRRRGRRRLVRVPMFAGYLFLHHAMDRSSHVDIKKVRGLVRVLGEGWDRLAVIPDDEMAAIERVASVGEPILPFPYLAKGQRVRITAGPLAGVEGFFVDAKADRGVLVVSVNLLQRSIAVSVDATDVTPAN